MRLKTGGIRLLLRYRSGQIVLEDIESNETKTASEQELIEAIHAGIVVDEDNSQSSYGAFDQTQMAQLRARGVTQRAIEIGDTRVRWINALRAEGVNRIKDDAWVRTLINQLAKGELEGVERVPISTLYDTDLKIRNAGGDVCAAVPDYASRGGVGQSRADPRSIEVLRQHIDAELEVEPPRPIIIADLISDSQTRIKELNLALPDNPIAPLSETTARRYVRQVIPAEEFDRRKYGKKKTAKLYRENAAPRDGATHPLERSQWDDIDAGVFLIDERHGLPFGRSYVTNGIDEWSHLGLGCDIGDKPRSFTSAARAICDSLLPHGDCSPGEMGYGAQGDMLLDNASYNKGKAMRHQSAALDLLLSKARPYGPTEKSQIEHFNYIVKSDFCTKLPGWRGDKTDRDAILHGMSTAALSLQHFTKLYRHWLTKIYPYKPGEDGHAPRDKWLRYYGKHGPAVRYSRAELALFRLRPIELTFRASGGLKWLKLPFDSAEVEALRRRLGHRAKVVAYVDTEDLHKLHVLDPHTRKTIVADCLEDADYLFGLTETQQKLILQIQRSRAIDNPSRAQLREGRELLKQMVAEALADTRMRTRRWARKAEPSADDTSGAPKEEGANGKKPGNKAPASVGEDLTVTELEYEIRELQEIELTEEEMW